ncbi:MAG: 8-amino-7-oxononanoate synthase [Tepidisphaeraceae bacterium]
MKIEDGFANASGDDFDDLLAAALDDRRQSNLLRQRCPVRPIDATHVEIDGARYVNFCSNNYLGLTHHPRVVEAIARAAREQGGGSGASALISGYTQAHASAEAALARWKGTESAVLLPSGYQANHAAVQTIAGVVEARGRSLRFLLDKLAHASLIDAVRGCGLPLRVFPHNDLTKLARLLSDADPNQLQVVVTESIFSMDGDPAPLAGLADLKRNHSFVLLMDEAHGSGVYGPNGAGLAAELDVTAAVDVFVITLSKALGSIGGAVCASKSFCDAMANFGRAYIYSTSVPPSVAVGCEAALGVMRDEPQHQQRVRALAARVRSALAGATAKPAGDSPIIPVVLGEESRAIEAAERLRKEGLLILPVRPPTVPRGTSRLRVTVSSAHTDEEIDRLIDLLLKEKPTAATPSAESDR